MQDYHQILGIIGAAMSLASFIPYIVSILKRKTRPNRITWSLWTLSSFIVVLLYLGGDEPVGWTILLPIMYVVGQGSTALLSFKYGIKKWSHFDATCLILGILSIAFWIIFSSPILALITVIVGDLFGALPTVRKTYVMPETEDVIAWSMTVVGDFLVVLAVPTITVFTIAFPLYMFLINGCITLLAFRQFIRR